MKGFDQCNAPRKTMSYVPIINISI